MPTDRPRLAVIASIAALGLQPVVFYWSVLVTLRAHIPYDVEGYYFPVFAYMARSVRDGRMPFWDPYTYAGMPLYGDLQAQLFYPPTWAAILLGNLSGGRDLFYWVEWLLPFHMILAGLFTFLLLRRMSVCPPAALLGATVYQLGGYFASQASHLGAIACAAWFPLSILAVFEMRAGFRSRWFAMLALATAMSILSGFAATTLVAAGATLIFALALWRPLPAVLGAFAVALMLAAIQLVPLWQLTGLSIASTRSAWMTAWGAPVESLVSLVRPNYYHIFDPSQYKLPYNFTFLYVYCGIAPLLLLLIAPFFRSARFFLGLTVVSALWMLGEHTPIYPFVFEHLPALLRGGLYAWYAMMAFCLFAGITAAIVLDGVGRHAPQAVIWAIALVTAWDLVHTGADRPMNTAAGSYRLSSPRAPGRIRKLVDTSTPPVRIDYADVWSPQILGASMLELPTPDGNIPFMLRRMFRLRRLFAAPGANDPLPLPTRNIPVTRFDSPLLRMLNVGFIGSVADVKASGLEPMGSVAGLNLYRTAEPPLPRYFLVPSLRSSADEDDTFRALARPSFDPAREAIVEGIPADRKNMAQGLVRVETYAPNQARLNVRAEGPAFLVTSETLYPGWEATIDGRKQPLLMTNGVFRGLELPAGTTEVVMTYRPAHLVFASLISVGSLLAIVAGMGFGGASRRR